ncbi:MAG: CRISPR-associated protein Cas4 [Thermoplasmata archaeon]
MYEESELIPISALQHFVFCQRQCALIFIEGIWDDNALTMQGTNLHRRAHTPGIESHPELKKIFDMPLRSLKLGLVGRADVVIKDITGNYIPLEYKHGIPKIKEMDTVQLCAQALCLEEMTDKIINEGFLYYFGIKRRVNVIFSEQLRSQTLKVIKDTRQLFEDNKTPPPNFTKKCKSCSVNEYCLPETFDKKQKIETYLSRMLKNSCNDEIT